MADWQKDTNRFYCLGMDLNRPVDATKDLKYTILKNVRVYQSGRIETRQGLTSIGTVCASGVNSLRRLNDPSAGTYIRILGGKDVDGHNNLYADSTADHATFTENDTGYNGQPLAMVPYRPEQSPATWMFISNLSRMRKINIDGTVHQIGLPAPASAPNATMGIDYGSTLYYKVIDLGNSITGWSASGVNHATYYKTVADDHMSNCNPVRVDGGVVHIDGIVYHSGTTGWCHICPSSMNNINEGMRILVEVGGGPGVEEDAPVQSIHRGSSATTISAIEYDAGVSGDCSIVLASPLDELEVDSMLLENGANYGRVLAVFPGPKGTNSIRANSGVTTWVAGRSIQAVPSFKTCTVYAHTAGATKYLGATGVEFILTDTCPLGTEFIQKDIHTTPISLGFFEATGSTPAVPSSPSDYVHCSFKVKYPGLLSEGKIMFDVSNDATFGKTYYYKPFRVSDLTPNLSLSAPITYVTTTKKIIQQVEMDAAAKQKYVEKYFQAPATGVWPLMEKEVEVTETQAQLPPASNQWIELRFPISDLIRVGTDETYGLNNIYYIRISFTHSAGTTGLEQSFAFHSLGMWGGHGPDCGTIGDYYLYRYRARCTSTGAKSNWSPATRGGLYLRRQAVNVAAPIPYALDVTTGFPTSTVADVLDFQRFGGTQMSWRYVGTVQNTTPTPAILVDHMPDDIAIQNSDEDNINYQLWPIHGTPVSYADGVVVGTTVKSTAHFSTSWAPGTRIQVNGQWCTIYHVINTSKLEINENAGVVAANGVWNVPEPIIVGQGLPCLWGPLNETLFACGDNTNPQRLYFTNVASESTRDINYIDITTPSERLMNGVIYNGRCYVWSGERMFHIIPGSTTWDYMEIPGSRGLFNRWGFTGFNGPTGEFMNFLSKDGIYATDGGSPASITEEDLMPLFPNEGNPGTTVNGVVPPDMVPANYHNMFLSRCGDFLYFDFIDTAGNHRTLVHHTDIMEGRGGWFYDDYTPDIFLHYSEEGSGYSLKSILAASTDKLYQVGGGNDAGVAISCQLRTKSRDQEEPRTQKLYGDYLVDANPNGGAITITPGFDNYVTTLAAETMTGATRFQQSFNINAGLGREARNFAIDMGWTASGVNAYAWQPTYLPRPETTLKRLHEYDADNYIGDKYFRGLWLEADTLDTSRTIEIQYDGGTVAATLTVQHNGRLEKIYSFTPFIAKMVRLLPTDANSWKIYNWRWIRDEYPENSLIPTEWSDGGHNGEKFLMGMMLEADTSNMSIHVALQYDSDATGPTTAETFHISHNGRMTKAYSLATPVIAHIMRIVPSSDVGSTIRVFKVTYLFTPYAEDAYLTPDWNDCGEPGDKYFRGCVIECDTENSPGGVTIDVQRDGQAVAVQALTLTQETGRREVPFAFIPFHASTIRLVPQGKWHFFSVKYIYDKYAELAAIYTPWDNGGHVGEKFVQGFILSADSSNLPATITVQSDGGVGQQMFTATHNGLEDKPYSFTVPFYTHNLRIVPTSSIRIHAIKWIFEPAPELATTWKTPTMTHGLMGFGHIRDGYIAHASTANITLSIVIDGTSYTRTIAHGTGAYAKTYFVGIPTKGKHFQYILTSSAEFRLFKQDCEIRMKQWSSEEYTTLRPFGGASVEDGAGI